jgi:hypothetical protein
MTTPNTQARFPNLGKLSLAVLEHIVEPVIGSDAKDVLKAPAVEKQLRESLAVALTQTEGRFRAEHADPDLCRALLDLPLADLPSLKQSVRAFYDRPADPALRHTLVDRLTADLPNLGRERIDTAAIAYLKILREELVSISDDIRSKLSALALLDMNDKTAQMVALLQQITQRMSTPVVGGDLTEGHKLTAGGHIVIAEAGATVNIDSNAASTPIATLRLDNPFFVGGRINDPAYFFGREQLVREIRAELKKRSSVSIVGESQMGKSSLLYYLYATRADWLPEVTVEYIDLQRVFDESEFYETVLSKLGVAGNTSRQFTQVLATREVILLFDEVERLAGPDFSPHLHDLLRSLAQESNFAMCLATQNPLDVVIPPHPMTPASRPVSDFHNIFTVKLIGSFSEAEARTFLATRLANTGLTFSPAEITRLLADSQRRPAKLQHLAKALFEEKSRS